MKTVLITGGSRGIGAALVRKFSAAGFAVAFTYLHAEKEAAALAEKTGALAVRADAGEEADVLSSVAFVREKLGPVDILVNNAGVAGAGLLQETSLADWNRILAVDLTAAFLYGKAVLPDMLRKKAGRIVNISSVWGVVGASLEVAYSAAKAGLIGFTKALAKEVAPSGITVNAVAPGVIDTDMNARLSAEERDTLAEEIPACRFGTPDEVADAVFYLAGDGAAYVTGEVLNVGGGFAL